MKKVCFFLTITAAFAAINTGGKALAVGWVYENGEAVAKDGLEGQTVTEPITVMSEDGTLIIRGNTFVNQEDIRNKSGENDAYMLRVVPPQNGRVIYRDNRLINKGRISVHPGNKEATASMTFIDKEESIRSRILSIKNRYFNDGIIDGR